MAFGPTITRLKKIETILINDIKKISDKGLKILSELKSLKILLLGKTNVSTN